MRWETRHSSAEMMYLEVTPQDVRCYLNNHKDRADHWSYEEVLDGQADYIIGAVFGTEVVEQLKVEARAQLASKQPQ